MSNKLNYLSALILQGLTMISGLIIPRLIISVFGSEINGLMSSITQFLSFISLLEGGLGAVVLADLYKPLAQNDTLKVQRVLASCKKFFNGISMVFICYTVVLMVVFPLVIYKEKSFAYTSSLVMILSTTTLVQYLFSITHKLLIQADRKIFVVNYISSINIIFNLLVTVILIKVFPNIHAIKIIASVFYLSQPIFYQWYVNKTYPNYHIRDIKNEYRLENRWDGFWQNFAHFITLNTDIAVITVLLNLKEVSVYAVYMLALNALRTIISTVANSYQGDLGNFIALEDYSMLKKKFNKFEKYIWLMSIVLFSVCIILIIPFVNLYIKGVSDADYYRPIFAIVMIFAQFMFSVREPYRLLVLSAGQFKETNKGCYIEAIINIVVSLALVYKWGLVGVAIGTLAAGTYRLIYFIHYLRYRIILARYLHYVKFLIGSLMIAIINIVFINTIELKIDTIFLFGIYGVLITGIETVLTISIFKLIECLESIIKRSLVRQ